MNKEELKKEAWQYADKVCGWDKTQIFDYLVEAYLASAEPREKRIEELEKENAELKRIVKMVAMINKGVYSEEGIKAIYAEAEQFLKDSEVKK